MAFRDKLSALLSRPATRVVESPVREAIEEYLQSKHIATRAELDAMRLSFPDPQRLETLEQEILGLQKKLSMAIGALQAATTQVSHLQQEAETAVSTARQANQIATSAKATADAAADGVEAAENHMLRDISESHALDESSTDACLVADCDGKIRAKGFCARHYQQWKRNNLEGFVNVDGTVQLVDGTRWQVSPKLAGAPIIRKEGELLAKGSAVPSEPLPT